MCGNFKCILAILFATKRWGGGSWRDTAREKARKRFGSDWEL
jgi:hypothetical protein